MKKYEYKFIEVPVVPGKRDAKPPSGDKLAVPFDSCKEIIHTEAAEGWRLKQILEPRMSIYGANCYQLIFEREEI